MILTLRGRWPAWRQRWCRRATREQKPASTKVCRMSAALMQASPVARWFGVRPAPEELAAPFAVRDSTAAERRKKVDRTRPGWSGVW